ncbi:putative DNA-binding pseudobarrel domain superfamily [Helianthus anomalus]
MSGPFVKNKLIIQFHGRLSWVLSYKRVGDGVAITNRWKTFVDQLGLKIGCLLVFTPFQSYLDFLLTAFNVDFDVVCKKKKLRLSDVCLVDDPCDKNRSFSYIILDRSSSRFIQSEIIRDHLGPSCYNGDYNILVDEVYTQNIKIGRSGNQFLFSRDWVKVFQQIWMKFAKFVLFYYMGKKKL